MSIKAIINNTEKEIEQIKNSDEQDIDYVYSRIGDTEVEGELPISIKSIGGNLADYRIYGNTVDGESVGNRTENILNELPQNRTNKGITFTNYDNKYIRITGISSDAYAQTDAAIIYLEAGTYSIRFFSKNSEFNTNIFVLLRHLDNTKIISINVNGGTFTLNNGETIRFITGVIQNNVEINTDVYYMVIKQSQIPDEYEPYGYKIPVTNNSETANIYLDEPLRKVGDEAEYIDYGEQKQHRVGAEDIDVALPALPTIKGTNTFSVNTSIQPSNIYIKDSFDYKKVFTATRTIEDELPLNYRNIEDNDSTLDNYRIYGNTVGGESVGDRTGNLFDENYPGINDRTLFRAIYVGTGFFTLSSDIPIFYNTANLFLLSGNVSDGASSPVNGVGYGVPRSAESIDGYITIGYRNYYDVDPRDYNVMLSSGTNPLPYEPYGYKVPVTVSNGTDTLTTPIYLPEQIKKVGDEAEYVDYAEQKMHRIGADDIDVILPALPILTGTNVLSVGTAVQPSEVEIKGHIK